MSTEREENDDIDTRKKYANQSQRHVVLEEEEQIKNCDEEI